MTLPDVPDTFRWTEETWGPALRCRPLEPLAPHVFTTRQLELSRSDGGRELALALGAEEVVWARQVHGARVVAVGDGGLAEAARPEGDVLVSDSSTAAIAVRSADCVPLLMADSAGRAVAAVHAGWRGTAARAAVAGVEAIGRAFSIHPSEIVVAIGPCIGPCCYEVGSDVVDAFAAAGHERRLVDRWFRWWRSNPGSADSPSLRLDLVAANRDQLILAGVPESAIHVAGLCTAMHLDVLTSYRAEKGGAGRIAGAIRAKKPAMSRARS
jgi:hypothetical protein